MRITAVHYYQISKYNPIYRPEEGGYSNDEWTSVSDIGLYFNGIQFTASEYFEMEDKYWKTIEYLLDLCSIKEMKIIDLCILGVPGVLGGPRHFNAFRNGYYDFFTENKYFSVASLQRSIQDKENLNLSEIEIILRLCLRCDIWCKLEHSNGTGIYVGYDYYMEFRTNVKHTIDYSQIPEGIFIETDGFTPNYPYITGDEDEEE